MFQRVFAIVVVPILALVSVKQADATVYRFDFGSTCASNCASIGLNDGDPISGFFTLNTAGQTPLSSVDSFSTVLLVDYGISVGNIVVDSSTASAVRFFGKFGANLDMFGNFALFIANELSPNKGDAASIYGGSIPYTTPDAGSDIFCTASNCVGYLRTTTGASLNPVPTTPLTGVEVPLPAGIWLLAGGLGVLGVVSRRTGR